MLSTNWNRDMARPKEKRLVDGVALAENLYPDNKGRSGYYRYRKPDGKFRHFHAASVEEANKLAESANARRDTYAQSGVESIPHRSQISYYIPDYIRFAEKKDPDLKGKSSWRNRKYALVKFCRTIEVPLGKIDRDLIAPWWESLTHSQQILRQAEFRRFFNYLMGRGLLPKLSYNPFTTADDKPRFYLNRKPRRRRQRLTIQGFWLIYEAAGDLGFEALQIAMGLSLTTFMREQDICTLKIDEHLEGQLLKRIITKSVNQKGTAKAARLKWDVGNYELLRQLIQRGKELSLKNGRCPFLISHRPKQRRVGKTKIHMAQVTTRRLQTMFNEARDATGFFNGEHPPTFHEIRSLADKMAMDAGYSLDDIQRAMAHSSMTMTLAYQDGHNLPFDSVNVRFTAKDIGGNFS